MAIILRKVKGISLTYDEMDGNLSQFAYSGSVSRGVDQHTLSLHYTGSAGLGYVPRTESININPFPFRGSAQITGSLNVTGSVFYNGALLDTLFSSGSSAVSGGLGINILTQASESVISLNTASAHFQEAVYNFGIFRETGSFWNTTNNIGITGSLELTGSIYYNGVLLEDLLTTGSAAVSGGLGINIYTEASESIINLNTGSAHFQDGVYKFGIFRETGSFWNTTNNVGITGSLVITPNSEDDSFSFDVSGSTQLKVNSEGIIVMTSQSITPTAVAGGMYYGSDNSYYLGFT